MPHITLVEYPIFASCITYYHEAQTNGMLFITLSLAPLRFGKPICSFVAVSERAKQPCLGNALLPRLVVCVTECKNHSNQSARTKVVKKQKKSKYQRQPTDFRNVSTSDEFGGQPPGGMSAKSFPNKAIQQLPSKHIAFWLYVLSHLLGSATAAADATVQESIH